MQHCLWFLGKSNLGRASRFW